MFASSPGLSAMDHPVYDVWVLDCLADPKKPDPNKTGPQQMPQQAPVTSPAASPVDEKKP
jgi:hypothetical protein